MIHFDIDTLKQRLIFLEKKTLEESFWTDNKNNSSVLREMSNIKSKIEKYNNLKSEFDNLKDLSDLLKVESDDELARELIKNTAKYKNTVKQIDTYYSLKDKKAGLNLLKQACECYAENSEMDYISFTSRNDAIVSFNMIGSNKVDLNFAIHDDEIVEELKELQNKFYQNIPEQIKLKKLGHNC